MKRKNATRTALFHSILSLLLCVSMLVSTTFAWFTDEVVTGMNTIAAGNLDVELLANGDEVKPDTKLFNLVDDAGNDTWWEPGMVVYENLQVANVGTLALKYQMSMNFGNENNLNGHKLSEVLKVAVIDKVADTATRDSVLAAAKAADNVGTLVNFNVTGSLEAGEKGAEQAVVIFWEPNANEIDNLYNVNNGQKTSDGDPLHIEFGINLQATQLMHEEDSFGNDYDEFATLLPKAKVTNKGATTVKASAGLNGAVDEYELPFVLQFEPNESLEECKSSAYKYWHADYVVKADKDVSADSLALVGYYKAYCDGYNNGNWVALRSDEPVLADTPIRLVDVMGGGDGTGNGSIKVTYKDICQWGNDGTGFLCSATDLTGANAGTTITVELRMYANESDPTDSSYNGGTETGEYYVIGTYSYTFPAAEVDTAEELNKAVAAGAKKINVAAGTYTFPASNLKAGTTLNCAEGTVFEGNSKLNINGATVVGATFSNPTGSAADQTVNGTFKDCTFDGSNGLRWCYAGETVVFENCVFTGDVYGAHFDGGANDVLFKNCTFSGFNAFGGAITKLTMDGCTFKANGRSGYNGVNLWGSAEMINCTFVFDGTTTEWIDLCGDNTTGTFTGCVVSDGTTTRALVASDVGDYGTGNTITVN